MLKLTIYNPSTHLTQKVTYKKFEYSLTLLNIANSKNIGVTDIIDIFFACGNDRLISFKDDIWSKLTLGELYVAAKGVVHLIYVIR